MPTVKRNGSSIVLKGGKVSCECCIVNCGIDGTGFGLSSQAALTSSQYAALYAGGTWAMSVSGNITSSGTGGDYDVTTELTASGTASNSYLINSPRCRSVLDAGSSTGSVDATGSYEDNEVPPLVYLYDGASGTIGTRMFGYSLYNSGGTYPLGLLLSARADFYAQYTVAFEGPTISGPPIEVLFGTDRNLLLRTQAGGGSTVSLIVGGSTILFPASLVQTSLNDDPGTGSLSLTITFTPSAP